MNLTVTSARVMSCSSNVCKMAGTKKKNESDSLIEVSYHFFQKFLHKLNEELVKIEVAGPASTGIIPGKTFPLQKRRPHFYLESSMPEHAFEWTYRTCGTRWVSWESLLLALPLKCSLDPFHSPRDILFAICCTRCEARARDDS